MWRFQFFLFLFLGLCADAQAAPSIIPADGFNLRILQASATDVTTTPAIPGNAHNWFAGRFSGLARGRETTIRVNMTGNDTAGNKANVGQKWRGLRPLYTYADPNQYEAYTGYTRNENGAWISSDPFKKGTAQFAGNGTTPLQNVMPPAVAAEFLSEDGASWFPWQEIDTANPIKGNTFEIRHTFALPSASVAMRVPFTHNYMTQFIARFQAAQLPGITVDEIGETSGGRKLWCIRVEDPTGMASKADLRTVAVFAREHATEHATSWSVLGVLRGLLNDSVEIEELRMKTRWLLVPLQDPDGANMSRVDNMIDRWDDPKNNTHMKEVMAYSGYFRDYVDKGNTIDVTVSFHNVEVREAPNFMAPFAQSYFREATIEFNKGLFETLREAGYTVLRPEPSGEGVMSMRLYGWIGLRLGAMDLAYEVNDRAPENRLSVARLKNIGTVFGEQMGKWLFSPAGDKRHQDAQQWMQERAKKREEYFAKSGQPTSDEDRQANLLLRGF